MGMQSLTQMLEQLLSKQWEDLPKSTVERTKWVIADTLMNTWFGMRNTPELQNYLQEVGSATKDQTHSVPIIGTSFYASPYDSAILHGTAVVSHELDEGNQFAKGHPAAHLLAPMFNVATNQKVSGKEWIRAFMLGYEASARLAYAANMNDNFHPHGTWGIFGATIACGILLEKSVTDIGEAALLSASLPLATSWQAAVSGMSVRNLYTGLGCWQALQALSFQRYGFRSSSLVVQQVWGELLSSGVDEQLLVEELFAPPMIDKNYFKFYPACRFSHPAIDATLALMEKESLIAQSVDKVLVETYGLAARLSDPDPQTELAAKFSIPFLLSSLLHGHSLFDSFTEPIFSDSSIRRLAQNIQVKEDPVLTRRLPNQRAARVTITDQNQQQMRLLIEAAKGEYSQSFSAQDLLKKYEAMSIPEAPVLIAELLNFEENNDVGQWLAEISSPREA